MFTHYLFLCLVGGGVFLWRFLLSLSESEDVRVRRKSGRVEEVDDKWLI